MALLGTGKSFLLRFVVRGFLHKFQYKSMLGITASTGVASLRIGGRCRYMRPLPVLIPCKGKHYIPGLGLLDLKHHSML